MTLSLAREDIALLVGGAIAIVGVLVHNDYATVTGIAIGLGGKALGSVDVKPSTSTN